MRKILLILVPILLFAPVTNADISARRDSLREMAYEQALIPSGGTKQITDAIANRLVNRAVQQVCFDFPAIEKIDTVVSAKGAISYSLNSDYSRLSSIFKLTDYFGLKIIYGLSFPAVETWFEVKGGEVGGLPDPNEKPEPRYAAEFADQLYFYPVPQKADSFVVTYYAVDSQLTTDASATSVIPEYRERIVIYAAMLMALRRGDLTRAEALRQLYGVKQ